MPAGRAEPAVFFGWVNDPEPRVRIDDATYPMCKITRFIARLFRWHEGTTNERQSGSGAKAWRFFSSRAHGFDVYFYLLIILVPVEFLSLYFPSLDAQMWSGSAESFQSLRGYGPGVDRLFFPARGQSGVCPVALQDAQVLVARTGCHAAIGAQGASGFFRCPFRFSLLLCAPLLVWAGAISRTPLTSIAGTFLFLLFYAVSYGVWGLAALVLWERRVESRQVFIRCFFVCLVLLSGVVLSAAQSGRLSAGISRPAGARAAGVSRLAMAGAAGPFYFSSPARRRRLGRARWALRREVWHESRGRRAPGKICRVLGLGEAQAREQICLICYALAGTIALFADMATCRWNCVCAGCFRCSFSCFAPVVIFTDGAGARR